MAFTDDIRIQLLGENDTATLSDAYVTLMVTDAKKLTTISSENMSLRYYTCYLIALNWDSIGAIDSREGTRYRKPEPEKYLVLYNKSLEDSLTASSYGAKESTTRGNVIDDDGILVKGNYEDQ